MSRFKSRYHALKALGLCTQCGKVNSNGRAMCLTCAERRNRQSVASGKRKGRYHLLKSLGLCVTCGKAEAVSGVRCGTCAQEHARQQNGYGVSGGAYVSRGVIAARTKKKIANMFELMQKMATMERQLANLRRIA